MAKNIKLLKENVVVVFLFCCLERKCLSKRQNGLTFLTVKPRFAIFDRETVIWDTGVTV